MQLGYLSCPSTRGQQSCHLQTIISFLQKPFPTSLVGPSVHYRGAQTRPSADLVADSIKLEATGLRYCGLCTLHLHLLLWREMMLLL